MASWRKIYAEKAANNPFLQDWDCFGIFMYLVGTTAWKPTQRWIEDIGEVVLLNRGQTWCSVRKLSRKSTSERRVRTILKRLKSGTLIDTRTDTRGTIVTICNFERYQGPSSKYDTPNDTPNDTAATQQRHSSDTPIVIEELDLLEGLDDSPKGSRSPDGDHFAHWWSFWTIKGTKRGKERARKKYRWITKEGRATPQQLADGLAEYMDWNRAMGRGSDLIMHPLTWLSGEHWKDDLVVSNTKRNGHAIESPEQIAERVRQRLERENGGSLSLDDEAYLFGEGHTVDADRSTKPDDGSREHDSGSDEVPPWLDPGFDRSDDQGS